MLSSVSDLALRLFELGGPVVLILVAMSVIAMSVAIYKVWQFRTAGVGQQAKLRDAIAAWDAGECQKALGRTQNSR